MKLCLIPQIYFSLNLYVQKYLQKSLSFWLKINLLTQMMKICPTLLNSLSPLQIVFIFLMVKIPSRCPLCFFWSCFIIANIFPTFLVFIIKINQTIMLYSKIYKIQAADFKLILSIWTNIEQTLKPNDIPTTHSTIQSTNFLPWHHKAILKEKW